MAPNFAQLSAAVGLLVLASILLVGWTHLSLNREEQSFQQGLRSQRLEDQVQLLLDKHKQLEDKVESALPFHSAVAGVASSSSSSLVDTINRITSQLHDPQSADFQLARKVSARYNARYWLESKPFWPKQPLPVKKKFLSFEPWSGGFNNIRMSLEMAAAMALALDRTLVMPPKYKMYLRGTSDFQDYFDYEDMRRGISCVTYQEFRQLVKLGEVDGHGEDGPQSSEMSAYYRGLAKMPPTRAAIVKESTYRGMIGSQLVFCFPNCGDDKATEWFKRTQYKLHPVDTSLQPEVFDVPEILHFGPMLLGHFYTMVYFAGDPQRGQRIKRVVRDHIHFHEEMFALAERVIDSLGGDFTFSCLHVRRNDFQFKEAWTSAEDIVRNVGGLWRPQERIYIATDELSLPKQESRKQWSDPLAMSRVKEHAWFEPMRQAWGGRDKVKFWSDYHTDLQLDRDVKKIWLGSVESLVCARARVFVGTQKSTFSGYIWRLRGYMHDVGQKEYLEAQTKYPDGYFKALPGPSWGLFPHGAFGGGHPYWGREYREAFQGVYDPFY